MVTEVVFPWLQKLCFHGYRRHCSVRELGMHLIVVFPWLKKLCFHGYRSCVSMVTGDIVVSEDEEYNKVKFEKIKSLRTVFQKDGK